MELLEFIKSHENWEELLSADPYNIKISRDNGYILFKYNQLSSDFSNPIVKECRGIILREADFRPVCVPFFKFMNAEEPNSDLNKIDWSTASVQEKIDGSLMKVWFDNGWHISTNGTIDAFKAELASLYHNSFGALFLEAVRATIPDEHEFFFKLKPDFTYMFELVSPENRVVIPYEKTELYFLGARNNETLLEYDPESVVVSNLLHYFKIPKRYNLHSFDEIKNAANELPWDEEGYVCRDKYFHRVKIKSPKYVAAHYCRNNSIITHEHLLEVILSGERAEFLTYASDFKDELDKVERAYCLTIAEIKTACSSVAARQFESRKDLAMYVKAKPSWIQGFMFAYDKLDEHLSKIKPSKWVEFMKAGGYLD